MTNFEIFKSLHHQEHPLLLGNIWDVHSAKLFEKNGFPAVATSSAALARAFGYEDGEEIPFRELFFAVEKMIAGISIPLSVDLEKGYSSDIFKVIDHINALSDAGAVGINMEDSIGKGGERALVSMDDFSRKIATIKNHLVKSRRTVFFNARTDAFLLKQPSSLEQSLTRAMAYENAGADGIFVPFVKNEEDIKAITGSIKLPLNVLCMPELPPYERLAACGVKRISMGSSIFTATYKYFENLISKVNSEKMISLLF